MADNALKTPFGKSINTFAEKKVLDAIQLLGKALPASVVAVAGSIVTVKFELDSPFTLPVVTCPLFGPEYIRYPIQAGDRGVVLPAAVRLGGVSGLGGGVADLTTPANLSALVFLPCGNKNWSGVDPNAVTVYGPNGVVLKNTAATSTIILLPAGIAITGQTYVNIICGACSIMMTATSVVITDTTAHTSPAIMNAAFGDLVTWLNAHTHSDPQGGTTGAPTSPFSGGNIAPTP